MIKIAITLTWSKIMAGIIFIIGTILTFLLQKENPDLASQIFTTTIFVTAGLLGWRQAATAVQNLNGANKYNVNDNRVSEKPNSLPVTEP